MNQAINHGIYKAAWLLMLRDGGRWKPAEIARLIAPQGNVHVARILSGMVKSGMVRRFVTEGKGQGKYGVTMQCCLPMGVTLAELVEAGAVQQELG